MAQQGSDIDGVLAANRRFYDAFGSLEIDNMDLVWDTSQQVLCIHPSSGVLKGWRDVRRSWEDIFDNTTLMHFNITGAEVRVQGDCAWVSCVENISTVVNARAANFTVQATNIFVRKGDTWLMVHHHGSA